jgi:hypothetical protein
MTRSISASNITASQGEVIRPILLIKLEFDGETIYINNSVLSITFDGNAYVGAGSFIGISLTQEGIELRNYSIDLTLTGLDSSLISEALGVNYKNRDATVYLAFLTSNHALVDDPFIVFKGRMDVMPIDIGKISTITLTVEGRLADWERARVRRYTDEDQRKYYSNDKGFEYVPQMVEKVLIWGRA